MIMSAAGDILGLIKKWQPGALSGELRYRNSLAEFLREQCKKDVRIETEYRHNGTTADIYLKLPGFFTSTEIFIELKFNLTKKGDFDRLIGQIEYLQPRKNFVFIVLCGKTDENFIHRLREKYIAAEWVPTFAIHVVQSEQSTKVATARSS